MYTFTNNKIYMLLNNIVSICIDNIRPKIRNRYLIKCSHNNSQCQIIPNFNKWYMIIQTNTDDIYYKFESRIKYSICH